MRKLKLSCCAAFVLGAASTGDVWGQVGCTLNRFSGTTSAKIHFVGSDVDWGKLGSATSAWRNSCRAASVIPSFAFGGQAGAVSGAHVVQVSVVSDSQMVNRGACAEANRNVFRINKDVPCPQNDVYTHELGHVLGLRNTTMVNVRAAQWQRREHHVGGEAE